MEERWVVGGVERIGGVIPVRPLPLTIQDGVVQFESLSLVVIERPAEEVRRVDDVHGQVAGVGQDGDGGQDCAK